MSLIFLVLIFLMSFRVSQSPLPSTKRFFSVQLHISDMLSANTAVQCKPEFKHCQVQMHGRVVF